MKQKPLVLRLVALVLAVWMLTGCSGESMATAIQDKLESYGAQVEKDRTISKDSKWVDSSIEGAIDEDSPINYKDDFYTAINRDFLLEPLPEGIREVNFGTAISDQFDENFNALYMYPEDTEGADPEILPTEKLDHIQSLVSFFIKQGSDVEGRADMGVTPLVPYLEAVEDISNLEDLTDYFRNTDGRNLFYLQLAFFGVQAPFTDKGGSQNTVLVLPDVNLSLYEKANYGDAKPSGFQYDLYNREVLNNVLGQLGYTTAQVNDILAGCYRFECKLTRCMPEEIDEEYLNKHDTLYTREELDAFCGSYPLGTILDACGLGDSDSYTVPAPLQLKELGRLYQEKNLEDIKSYLTVHTVLNALDLLDDDTYGMVLETIRQRDGEAPEPEEEIEEAPETDESEEEEEEETDEEMEEKTLEVDFQPDFSRFVQPYLSDAFQQMYVARYCTAQQKEELTELVLDIQAAFRETLENADWMGEETRVEALAKLDNMGLHVLYPDEMIDYTDLSFDGCENLLDAVSRLNRFNMATQSERVNQPVKNDYWDMASLPTTDINAYYLPSDNSINILAGFLTTDEVYGTEKTIEENLAGIGTVIGHEITHGFDTNGYQYDLHGHLRKWWTKEDQLAFDTRAASLIRYYSGLTPVSKGSYLDGENLSGEAIADMGGMKSALKVAEGIEDFDYDLFFCSYAYLWRTHCTMVMEMMNAADEHPLGCLRANVTLVQFDEFQEFYELQPGDGMYLAPEDRILVW